MGSIPLEENLNWWWYKAKSNLLNHILLNSNIKNNIRILEIGPGLGNNLSLLNKYGDVDILENELEFISHLQLTQQKNIKNIYKSLDEVNQSYNLIVMLDVLEHIENSKEFMDSLNHILNTNGIIIIGVPAYQSLWSVHDEKLLHFRRYNWKKLYNDCKSYDISERYGLNYLLFPVRYFQIKLNKTTSTNSSGTFINKVLYAISFVEVLLRKIGIKPKFGISIYAKLKKRI
tara:strand:- start:2701 stop:3393 length:693 start_codon:yes stop_codon:yes gene_type:complete